MFEREKLARILLVGFFILVALVRTAAQVQSDRVEIAEGEYAVFTQSGGIGPIEMEVYSFHETWQMWRFADGHIEVEGNRLFEMPKGFPSNVRFLATAVASASARGS